MAQSKLNDLASKFGKGGPPGLGIGLKVLAVGAAAAYGISQSMFTGNSLALFTFICAHLKRKDRESILC